MVKVVVVSRSLSVYSAWIDLPSEETVNAFMKQMFGYDPSVSWKVVSIDHRPVNVSMTVAADRLTSVVKK